MASDSASDRTLANSFTQNANTGVIFGDSVQNGTLTLGTLDFGGGTSRALTMNSDVIINGSITNGSFTSKTGAGGLILKGYANNSALFNQVQGNVIVDGGQLYNSDGWRLKNTLAGATMYFVVTNGGLFKYNTAKSTGNFLIGLKGGNGTANNVLDISGTLTLILP